MTDNVKAGKYDEHCARARESTRAQAALLMIANGEHGSGFSVQGPPDFLQVLPDLLEGLAHHIRADIDMNLDPERMSRFALMTMGQVVGLLARDEVRALIVQALRDESLNAHYLVHLRDTLTAMLLNSGKLPS